MYVFYVTLRNVTVRLTDGGSVSPSASSSTYRCSQPYGRIEDSGSPYRAPLRICGTERRVEPLMVSRGSTVRVWLDPSGGGTGHRRTTAYGSAASSHYDQPEPNRFLIYFTGLLSPRRLVASAAIRNCFFHRQYFLTGQ